MNKTQSKKNLPVIKHSKTQHDSANNQKQVLNQIQIKNDENYNGITLNVNYLQNNHFL